MPDWATADDHVLPANDCRDWMDDRLARFLGAVFEGYDPEEEERFQRWPDARPLWSYRGEPSPVRVPVVAGVRDVCETRRRGPQRGARHEASRALHEASRKAGNG